MHLIGNVSAWADDNPMWRRTEPVELVDEHYYRDSKWFADNFHKYDVYLRLGNLSNVYVGEYAVTKDYGKMGSLNAALGEAISLCQTLARIFKTCELMFKDTKHTYQTLAQRFLLLLLLKRRLAQELRLRREKTGQKIYLFIDEYDHFTNTILSDPKCLDSYKAETHGTGYLRKFFDTIKSATDSTLERVFVTGVSPVTMDDLTSGFNIGTNYSLEYEFNEMTGFTEEEVRDLLTYYTDTLGLHNYTIDELIEIMKPWYDNYCFAEDAYGETTMYNSNMVLYFIDHYIRNRGKLPKNMIEENIRLDYNKLRMLIRKDKEFAHDASIIQQLVQNGFVTGELKTGFPAEKIGDPDNFVSLLYYFGMVTIAGQHKGKTKFVIPNQVVREQIFQYLLDTYKENDLQYDSYEKGNLESDLAYEGKWKPYFQYIADCLHKYSSQRDHQKGEYFVHGFTLAMTCDNKFYRPISEKDTQERYADIFLRPLIESYTDMLHSYIVELKYAKSKDTDAHVQQLREDAIAQVNRYAESEVVTSAIKTTQLHKIIVIYKGTEMVVCEEV